MKPTARFLFLIVSLVSLLGAAQAMALAPERTIAQYKHTKWTIEEGAPLGIEALAQSPDGYLWIGTLHGLYRFDGVTFEHIPPIAGDTSRSDLVTAVLATRSGDIWAGYYWGGIAVFRDGKLQDFNHGPSIGAVGAIIEDADGGVWVHTHGAKQAELSRYAGGKWQTFNEPQGVPDAEVSGIAAGGDGTVWIVSGGAVRFLSRGSDHFERAIVQEIGPAVAPETAPDVLEVDAQGRVWLVNANGEQLLKPERAPVDTPSTETSKTVFKSADAPRQGVIDRDGGIWITTASNGILRLRPTGMIATGATAFAAQSPDAFGLTDGLTAKSANTVIEDREGDIWVGTTSGLDRFRAASVVTETRIPEVRQDNYLGFLDNQGAFYLVADQDLYRLAPEAGSQFSRVTSLPIGDTHLCQTGDGTIWVTSSDGIGRLQTGHVNMVTPPVSLAPGGAGNCAAVGDTVWFSITQRGLYRYAEGKFEYIVPLPDLPARRAPWLLSPDQQGSLLVSYARKAFLRIDPAGATHTIWQGLNDPVGFLRVIAPGKHYTLLGGEEGLARLVGDSVTRLSSADYPRFRDINGIVQTQQGETWLFEAGGIERLSTAELDTAFEHPGTPLHGRLYDVGDGVSSGVSNARNNLALEDHNGRVWFFGADRIFWIDPSHLATNLLPPPVSIRSLVANDRRYAPMPNLALDAGLTKIELDYTALSLQAPDRVQFRYRLDGMDKDWIDPGSRRQAFYTNLGPGHYSFHVIAANNDGVWNNTGAMLAFDIPPTFRQTKLFSGLCAVTAMGLLWAAYALRLRQIQGRLEVRVAERERIARELHDTLLQGFQGLMLRFQAATDQIPAELPAHGQMEQALDRAEDVLVEGRDRVRDLRTAQSAGDLSRMLADAADRLEFDPQTSVRVIAEGAPRDLHPAVCDEIVAIGKEALFNISSHAKAKTIEIAVRYDSSQLGVRFSDDGVGIDETLLAQGREGHFGLTGMRERAVKIGASFVIASRVGAGTELEIVVPANIAYARNGKIVWRWPVRQPLLRRS